MIDVMMFLLVFFVLISLNVIPALGLKTRLPVSSRSESDQPPRRVVVTLPREGGMQLDGDSLTDSAQLTALLRQRQLVAASAKIAVVINGDESVPLQRVIDVMDAVKASGIEALTFAVRRP